MTNKNKNNVTQTTELIQSNQITKKYVKQEKDGNKTVDIEYKGVPYNLAKDVAVTYITDYYASLDDTDRDDLYKHPKKYINNLTRDIWSKVVFLNENVSENVYPVVIPENTLKMLDQIAKEAKEQFQVTPDKFVEIPHKPDVGKFLVACKKLFPNLLASNVIPSVNAIRTFIENIHSTTNAEAKYYEQMLWLYSKSEGGCGKSMFCEALTYTLEKYYKTKVGTAKIDEQYLDPKGFLSRVAICEDTREIKTNEENLNAIIDHSPRSGYNIKYGASRNFQPYATIIGSSNYIPTGRNPRRYGIVEYLPQGVEHYSDEEIVKYFPTYYLNKSDKYETLVPYIKDLIECVPFSRTSNYFGLDGVQNRTQTEESIFRKSIKVLQFISDNLNISGCVRVRKFVDMSDSPDCEKDKWCTLMCNMLNAWHSKQIVFGRKGMSWQMGEPVEIHRFNFAKIINYVRSIYPDFDGGSDDDLDDTLDFEAKSPIETTLAIWDRLIAKYTTQEEPTPPTTPTKPTNPLKDPSPTHDEPTEKPTEKPEKITSKAQLDNLAKTYDLTFCKDLNTAKITNTYDNDLFMVCGTQENANISGRSMLTPTALCYESDTLALVDQLSNIKDDAKKSICSITYSGNKSYHILVPIPKQFRKMLDSPKLYKYIWGIVGSRLFKDSDALDKACATIGRLTRCPLSYRADKGKVQENILVNYEAEFPLTEDELKDFIKLYTLQCDVSKNQSNNILNEVGNMLRSDNTYDLQLDHLQRSQNKHPSEVKQMVLDVLTKNICPSGLSYISGVKLLNQNYPLLTLNYVTKVKTQHPTNLPKSINQYLPR